MKDTAVAGSGVQSPATTAPWAARVAGVLLVLVGVLNVGFGVLSLASTAVRMGTGAAVALIVAGAVTAFAGWLVWGGNRSVAQIALVIFGWLLIAQTADVMSHTGDIPVTGGIASRFTVLGILIVFLGVATVQLRRLPRT